MPKPVRSISDAEPGQITATPKRVLDKLGIRKLKVTGYKAKRGGRRG